MYLAPLALSLLLLLFWTVVGRSVVAVCTPTMACTKALLISPAIGLSLLVILIYWLNLFFPVDAFAKPLLLGTICASAAAIFWKRPSFDRSDLVFFAPVLIGLLIFGAPTLKFGFDWVANANDDWANYNLRATRFLQSRFFEEPSIEQLRAGRDYPGFMWFFDVVLGTRAGSDHLLSWVASLTGKSPFLIFMPVILALQSVLVLTATSLVPTAARRQIVLAAAVLAAIAPLSMYAVHQQLIGQVFGLALMCSTAAMLFVPFTSMKGVGYFALCSITIGGYWLVYPETTPFFVLAFIIYHAVHARTPDWGWATSWRALFAPLATCVLLGPYTLTFFLFLFSQFKHSATQGVFNGASIFPYFLVPNGLSILIGFSQLGETLQDPLLSISIGAGIVLVVIALISSVFGLLKHQSAPVFVVVFSLAALGLIVQHNDFGIFKVAMFVQTFVWFSLAALLMRAKLRTLIVPYCLLIIALCATDYRIARSAIYETSSAGELRGASEDKLLTSVLSSPPSPDTCEANVSTPVPPLAKIYSAVRGCARSFIARPVLFSAFLDTQKLDVESNPLRNIIDYNSFLERASAPLVDQVVTLDFPDGAFRKRVLTFKALVDYKRSADLWTPPSVIGSPKAARNKLVLLPSDKGSHYYLPEFGVSSLYGSERDPFFRNAIMAGVGRYLLFRIDNPTTMQRMVLDLTTTVMADRNITLPPNATIFGAEPVRFSLEGKGAARLLSAPFRPLMHDGIAYALLDFGEEAKMMLTPRPGLMALYGNDVALDYRRLTAFARRIDVVDAESDAPRYPSKIGNFPADLENGNASFSGFYEDGWVGSSGFLYLHADEPSNATMRGMLPGGIGIEHQELTISMGGRSVTRQIQPGSFELSLPVSAGDIRLEFKFTSEGHLPGADGRSVSAQLDSVSVIPRDAAADADPPKALPGVVVSSSGITWDRWALLDGQLTLSTKTRGTLLLKGATPGIEGSQFIIMSSPSDVQRVSINAGSFEVKFPVEAGTHKTWFAFTQSRYLPDPDRRRVAGIFESISFIPESYWNPVPKNVPLRPPYEPQPGPLPFSTR